MALLRLVPALLAVDRERVIIVAFATLIAAGVLVSIGAWIHLRREIRRQRSTAGDPEAPGAVVSDSTPDAATPSGADVAADAGDHVSP
jgi:hypothetical protein